VLKKYGGENMGLEEEEIKIDGENYMNFVIFFYGG